LKEEKKQKSGLSPQARITKLMFSLRLETLT